MCTFKTFYLGERNTVGIIHPGGNGFVKDGLVMVHEMGEIQQICSRWDKNEHDMTSHHYIYQMNDGGIIRRKKSGES